MEWKNKEEVSKHLRIWNTEPLVVDFSNVSDDVRNDIAINP